jgi:hypothetical protein
MSTPWDFFFFTINFVTVEFFFGYHIKLIRYTDDEVTVVSAHTYTTTSGDLCSRADKIALQRSNQKTGIALLYQK